MLLVFMASQAYGQKCKYDHNKTDAFTGEARKGITAKINNWLFLGFNKVGSNYEMGLAANLLSTEISSKGDSIIFKVVNAQNPNGIMLTLYSVADVSPTLQAAHSASHSTVYTTAQSTLYGNYRINYEMTEQQLELLSGGLVTDIRLYIGGKDFNVLDIKKNVSERLRQAVICILR